ncbi:MAG TPA: YkvA family protein [Burkholderiales bacterium]|nr:YkvA family protein [Burkholderiales bacterium]
MERLRAWARALKHDVLALWFACRDPRTPLLPKLLASLIVAYALSPIDLIPDFIPVLGFVDELILLPGALYLVLKLIPPPVMHDARNQARAWLDAKRDQPRSWAAAALIVLVWFALLAWLWRVIEPWLARTLG